MVKTEGYLCSYYWQSNGSYDQGTAPPPLLATIFQGNISLNSKATFFLNSGAMNTVMADTYSKNALAAVDDVPISGATQGSQGSITDSQLNILPIGSVPPNSNDLLQAIATSSGARAVAMGHEGTTSYTLENGGDILNLFGQQVTVNSEVVTRVTMSTGTTATGLLMMRASPTASSPFVSIGLSGGSIVVTYRKLNAGALQTTSIPYPSNSVLLKLTKSGSAFTATYSSDGMSWTPTQISVAFPTRSYIAGVGEMSSGTQTGPEVIFEGLTFIPVTSPAVNTGGTAVASSRIDKIIRSIGNFVAVALRAVKHALELLV